jgi:hypothetical protein
MSRTSIVNDADPICIPALQAGNGLCASCTPWRIMLVAFGHRAIASRHKASAKM